MDTKIKKFNSKIGLIYNDEEFMPIPGFDGYYASKSGKIYSIKKNIIRTQTLNGKAGYYCVNAWLNGFQKTLMVHRGVGTAWLEPPKGVSIKDIVDNPRTYQINHISEDKTQNNIENLEYCSPNENTNFGTRNIRISTKMANNKNASGTHKAPKTGDIHMRYIYKCDGLEFNSTISLGDYLCCSPSTITEAFRKDRSIVKGHKISRVVVNKLLKS